MPVEAHQPVAGWWLRRPSGPRPWVPRLAMWPWAKGHRGQGPELHHLRHSDLAVRLGNGQLVIVRGKVPDWTTIGDARPRPGHYGGLPLRVSVYGGGGGQRATDWQILQFDPSRDRK